MGGSDDNLGNACNGLSPATLDELRAIARLYLGANSGFMQIVNKASEMVSGAAKALPPGWQGKINDASRAALDYASEAALATQPKANRLPWAQEAFSWANGEQWHRYAAMVTGGLGGLGGIATTLIDLPITTTLIVRAIQEIAESYGEDTATADVRAECVKVFALGGPLPEDDSVDAGLWETRLLLTGRAAAEVLAAVLPRFGVVVSQKALAQAVPVLGAAAGAAVNTAFMDYFQTMAHVHFRLRKLEQHDDREQLSACLARLVAAERGARAA